VALQSLFVAYFVQSDFTQFIIKLENRECFIDILKLKVELGIVLAKKNSVRTQLFVS